MKAGMYRFPGGMGMTKYETWSDEALLEEAVKNPHGRAAKELRMRRRFELQAAPAQPAKEAQ